MVATERPFALTATRGEAVELLRLAGPLAAANLLQMAVYASDVIFIARLGAGPLAASSLAVSVVGLLLWAMSGLLMAASALIAAEIGARKHAVRQVRRTVRMALWLAILASAVAIGLCLLVEPFMRLTGQPVHLAAEAAAFTHILMWSLPFALVATVLRTFVATLGRATIATMVTLLALGVNILGNYLLVFGHFGFPRLGLAGSAIASIFTTIVTCIAYVIIIEWDRRFRRFHLFGRMWRAEWGRMRELLRIGLPIGGTILAEAGLFSGAAFLMGRMGEAPLAAHTIALQIIALIFQIPFGVGQAATIRVGLAYGAGDRAGIGRAGWTAIAMGLAFMTLSALTIWGAPHLLVAAYIDIGEPANHVVVTLALQYLAIAAAFQLFDGTQVVAASALRGVQDTRVPMMIAITGYWAGGYAAAIWLGFWTPLAGQGVWIGLAVGLVIVAAALLIRWWFLSQRATLPS
ncbi:MAG: MATE family efflux transporter [Sphingomonadaceae bacterium]|nr:MATE family efflux transporter [Sphingomonadaceae bacterium]